LSDQRQTITGNPLVGIVTPVYNGEAFLEECIESVLKQTYKNWQYVILNNSSTDRSLEIASKYAAADSRISVHNTTELLPQLQNFNLALSFVPDRAEYYKLILADDWIYPECIERMVGLAEKNPQVGIVSSYQMAGTQVAGAGLPYSCSVISGRELCRLQLLKGYFFFGSPSALLFRGVIVRSRARFFDESALHSDTEVCYSLLQQWDFGFVHQILTFCRMDNEGLTTSIKSFIPHGLDKFIVLLKYGREYLEEAEYESSIKLFRARYFRQVSRSLFFPNGWKQYTYHRNGLKSIGYNLSLLRLAPSILIEFLDMILNPKKTAGQLLRAFRGGTNS
jgi:glycosyltransferase involved in cell wall biosynthesis